MNKIDSNEELLRVALATILLAAIVTPWLFDIVLKLPDGFKFLYFAIVFFAVFLVFYLFLLFFAFSPIDFFSSKVIFIRYAHMSYWVGLLVFSYLVIGFLLVFVMNLFSLESSIMERIVTLYGIICILLLVVPLVHSFLFSKK